MGPWGALLLVILFWGTGYGAATVAIGGGLPPLAMTAVRLGCASILVALFARWSGESTEGVWNRRTIAIGIATWVTGTGFIGIGQRSVPAGTTAVVFAAAPLLTTLLGWWFWNRAPRPMVVGWLAVGCAAVLLLVGSMPAFDPNIGWTLFACVSWCTAQVFESARKPVAGPQVTASAQMGIGAVALGLLSVLVGETPTLPNATTGAALLWLIGPSTAIAYPLWLYVLRNLPIEIAMLQGTASPVVATIFGVLYLGEVLSPLEAVGALLILIAARGVVGGQAPATGPAVTTG